MKHSWGDAIRPDQHNTRRTCTRCGLVKVTRHEPDNDPPHWTEWERDGVRSVAARTPACEPKGEGYAN